MKVNRRLQQRIKSDGDALFCMSKQSPLFLFFQLEHCPPTKINFILSLIKMSKYSINRKTTKYI